MSNQQVDLYSSTYGNFEERVLAEIRREAYGEDIGQNSWITTDEYDNLYSWLNLSAGDHVNGCDTVGRVIHATEWSERLANCNNYFAAI